MMIFFLNNYTKYIKKVVLIIIRIKFKIITLLLSPLSV